MPKAEQFPLGASITLAQLERDPHKLLAQLREHEPLSWLPVLDGWLISRYDLALAVMRDARTFTVEDPRFSTAQVVGPSMLSLDGRSHDVHRQPFATAFRPRHLRERFAAVVRDEAERLVDAFVADGAAELRRGFAGPLAAATITHALSLERDEVADVLSWYEAIAGAVTDITAGRSDAVRGQEAFQQLRDRLDAVIASGKAESLLTTLGSNSALTSEQIISNAAVLLFGGIETTEGMIANATAALLERPAELEAAGRGARRLEAAIEESLRLEPAAAMVDRYATADVELGGAAIARGELVHVSITGANRDPAVFHDPDAFEPDRLGPHRHLAFAQGPHVCLGVHLARLEARIGIDVLLRRLPRLRLDRDRSAAVTGLVFRKPDELWAVWD